MIHIDKRIVINENGKPTEVIISWDDYLKIEEMLGLDFDKQTVENLKLTQ